MMYDLLAGDEKPHFFRDNAAGRPQVVLYAWSMTSSVTVVVVGVSASKRTFAGDPCFVLLRLRYPTAASALADVDEGDYRSTSVE